MTVSDVQIAKLALSYIGDRYDITSLTEAGTEAEQVNLVFENARDALLAEHPWGFAKTYYTPSALSATPPANWTYAFTYPAEALKVWRIEDPLGREREPIPFEVARITISGTPTKVLLTDDETPEFLYTYALTDPAEFSPHFVLALSWRIAKMIALPLTGSAEVKDRVERDAAVEIGHAKSNDANEGVFREQSIDPDWITARS